MSNLEHEMNDMLTSGLVLVEQVDVILDKNGHFVGLVTIAVHPHTGFFYGWINASYGLSRQTPDFALVGPFGSKKGVRSGIKAEATEWQLVQRKCKLCDGKGVVGSWGHLCSCEHCHNGFYPLAVRTSNEQSGT